MQGLSNNQNPNQPQSARTSTIDVPVRILVPSESVGAIIGKGGQTIRQLTQQTRAKVDVYRGDPMAPNTALQEKVITIRGQPENCINACREILKVMKVDAESKGKPSDAPLKVLAHNDYIGRIIGKQGNIINTIKKETETTVTVSSINDMSMNVERVITVKGELENMIRALEIIHSKVKSAFENDTKTYGAQAIMMGGIPPLPLAPPSFAAASSVAAAAAAAAAFNVGGQSNSAARYAAAAAAAAAAAVAQQQHSQSSQQQQQSQGGSSSQSTQNSSQPSGNVSSSGGAGGQNNNTAVSGNGNVSGSYSNYYQPMYHGIPGAGGVHPQLVSQNSNMFHGGNPQMQQQVTSGGGSLHSHQQADLVISQGPEPETVYLYIPNVAVGAIIGTKGSYIKNIIKLSGASVKITPLTPEESKVAVERQVVIIGTPESQWKAQYYIYDKIRQERFASDENVKLRAELQVPSHIVGRIIGKSGKNVRELQRSTGATIKLPEDATANQNQNQEQHEQPSETTETTNTTGEITTTTATTPATPASTTESEVTTNGDAVKNETKTAEKVEKTGEAITSTSNETKNEETHDTTTAAAAAAAATSTEGNAQENLENPASTVTPQQGYVIVRIFGTFQASQCAQRRIQSLVSQSLRGVAGPTIMDIQNPMGAGHMQHHLHHLQQQHHHLAAQTQLMAHGRYNNVSNHHQHHQIGLMPIASHFHHRGGNGVDYQHQNGGGPRINSNYNTRHSRRQHQQQQQTNSKENSFNANNNALPSSSSGNPVSGSDVNGAPNANNNVVSSVTATPGNVTNNMSSSSSSSSSAQNDQDQSPSVSSSSTTNATGSSATTASSTTSQQPQTPIIAATS